MNLEIRIDGVQVVNALVDSAALSRVLGTVFTAQQPERPIGQLIEEAEPKSSPLTLRQAREIVERIDARSKKFLRELATNGGSLTWREMRNVFEIGDDWSEFSRGYGKGITRVTRHVLRDPNARLVWWNDETWNDDDGDDPVNTVHIDGPALAALRSALE